MESKKQEVMLFEFVVYIQAKAQEQELPLAPRSFVLPFQAVTAFSIVTKIVDWIAYFENFPSQASSTFPTIPRHSQRANRSMNRNHRQGIVPKLFQSRRCFKFTERRHQSFLIANRFPVHLLHTLQEGTFDVIYHFRWRIFPVQCGANKLELNIERILKYFPVTTPRQIQSSRKHISFLKRMNIFN